jgi:hypothetical protein
MNNEQVANVCNIKGYIPKGAHTKAGKSTVKLDHKDENAPKDVGADD